MIVAVWPPGTKPPRRGRLEVRGAQQLLSRGKPAENRQAENRPAENRQADNRPAENKPAKKAKARS